VFLTGKTRFWEPQVDSEPTLDQPGMHNLADRIAQLFGQRTSAGGGPLLWWWQAGAAAVGHEERFPPPRLSGCCGFESGQWLYP